MRVARHVRHALHVLLGSGWCVAIAPDRPLSDGNTCAAVRPQTPLLVCCVQHPGNLLRTADGKLVILDFGLMTEVRRGGLQWCCGGCTSCPVHQAILWSHNRPTPHDCSMHCVRPVVEGTANMNCGAAHCPTRGSLQPLRVTAYPITHAMLAVRSWCCKGLLWLYLDVSHACLPCPACSR